MIDRVTSAGQRECGNGGRGPAFAASSAFKFNDSLALRAKTKTGPRNASLQTESNKSGRDDNKLHAAASNETSFDYRIQLQNQGETF